MNRPSGAETGEGQNDLPGLLSEIAAGSESALATLYDATSAWLHGVVLRIVRDPEAAEEATLDVYMKVWKSAASYAPERGRVEAWLFTIARSRAADILRSRARHSRETSFSEGFDPSDGSQEAPQSSTEDRERKELVLSAIAKLPEKQRIAIELSYFGGLSHTEVAKRLEAPLGSVKTQIRLGMMKLREVLRPLMRSA